MELRRARDTAQIRVVRRLGAGLPDLVVQVIALAEPRQLGLRDRADVAERLRREILIRVVPDPRAARRDTGELRRALGEVLEHRPARVVADRHRGDEVVAALPRLDPARDLVQRDARHLGQSRELGVAVVVDRRQVGRPELDRRRRDVRDERDAAPVEQEAARRRLPQDPE